MNSFFHNSKIEKGLDTDIFTLFKQAKLSKIIKAMGAKKSGKKSQGKEKKPKMSDQKGEGKNRKTR